ncbi:hypothetical protein [Streptomyces sp. NPDC018693]|uniref:hypothetical protein n=1 Tax=unclassified Streptomyces TaxID=2593676 RepID=UPI0037A987C4
MYFDSDEPVFRRSRWGTSNYQYNPRHPVGCALTVITVIVGGVVFLLLYNRAGPYAPPAEPTPVPSSTWHVDRFVRPTDDGADDRMPTAPPTG